MLGGGGPLILDPWFSSYFWGKQQANLHCIVQQISLGWAAWYWIQAYCSGWWIQVPNLCILNSVKSIPLKSSIVATLKQGAKSMDVNIALVPASLSVERLRDRLALARQVPGLENTAVPDMSGVVTQVLKPWKIRQQSSRIILNFDNQSKLQLTPKWPMNMIRFAFT